MNKLLFSLLVLVLAIFLFDEEFSRPLQQAQVTEKKTKNKILETNTPITTQTKLPNSINPINPIVNCSDTKINIENKKEVESLKANVIKNLTEYLSNKASSIEEKETKAQYIGVPLITFRRQSLKYVYNRNSLGVEVFNVKPIIPERSFLAQIANLLGNRDYDEIANLVADSKIKINTLIGGKSILTAIIAENKNVGVTVIDKIINLGIEPSFTDLVSATAVNAPVAVIQRLLENYKGQVNKTWYHNYRDNTLTMLAAENLNDTLVDFWLAAGSPIAANSYDLSAIDVMKTPKDTSQLVKAITIFKQLAAENTPPYDINTLNNIRKWLPQDIQSEYTYYFENHSPGSHTDHLDEETDEKFRKAFFAIEKRLAELNMALEQCGALPERPVVPFKDMESVVDFGAELQYMFNFFNKGQSDEIENEQTIAETRQAMQDLIKLENGEWGSYIKSINKLANETGSTEAYQLGLIMLITQNAPFDEIKKLINKVDQLPSNIIFILVMNNNTSLIEQLIPYGLAMDAKNQRGQNALEFALSLPASKSTIEYLSNTVIKYEDN